MLICVKNIYIVLQHLQTSYGNICYNLVYARSSKTNETFLKCYTLGTNLYLHQKYQEKCDFYFAKVTFLTPFDIFVDLMQLRLSLFFGHLQRENTILKRLWLVVWCIHDMEPAFSTNIHDCNATSSDWMISVFTRKEFIIWKYPSWS